MKIHFLLLIISGMFLAGCGNSKKNGQSTNTAANYNTGNPLTAPADYVGAVMQAKKFSEKQIDLAYVNHAIQEFNAGEGHYPTNLQEMIPTYLGKMPQAPYGCKIVYDPNAGTVKVVQQ